jgi:Arc/MetJ-type ribon-helix-helix transcriptional regulator
MGAIAVSEKEERQIEKLSKQLKIPTKSGVIRAALRTLEEKVEKERLRQEIQESVRRCAAADKEENRELFAAAVARNLRKE